MIALALGLLSLRFLPALPSVGWLAAGGVLAGCCLCAHRWFAGLLLLGVCWASASAHLALADRLPAELDGRTLWLEGRVAGLPVQTSSGLRFELEQATSRRGELPARLQLNWFDGPGLASGERWRLAVTLRRPHGLLNPHGPDREASLLARRIGATATVKAGERLQALPPGWREALRQRLLAVDAQAQQATLVALILGDGSGISEDQWQVLRATGAVHLLVISGQHIGLLAGLVYALVAGLARLGWWPQRLPWLPCACALSLLAALTAGLQGFRCPCSALA